MSKKLNGKAKANARAKAFKAKQAAIKPVKNLVSLGAFYKGLNDDGFSFGVNKFNEPKPGFTKMFGKLIIEGGKGLVKEIKEGTWTIAEMKAQLAEAILQYNFKVFGTTERPHNSAGNQKIDIMDVSLELTAILTDIYALEKLGHIKSDEYNGMSYAYTS